MKFLTKLFFRPDMSESEQAAHDLALQPQLQKVIDYVESVPEGRELIALAKKMNCPIRYDSRLRKQGMYAVIRSAPSENDFGISVDPSFSIPVQVSYLCHELRHLQQFSELPDLERFSSLAPHLQRIALRFQEADAHVFQMHMAKKIGRATGLRIPFRSGSGVPPYDLDRKNKGKTGDENKSKLRLILKMILHAPKVVKLLLHAASQKFPLGHYNPLERFRDGVNPLALFRDFQYGHVGSAYDGIHDKTFDEAVKKFPKGTLSTVFNEKSFKGVVDFKKMCRLGVNENAPSYLEGTETANIRFVGKCIGKKKFKKDAAYMRA